LPTLAVIVAFLASALACRLLVAIAPRLGLVDLPDLARKVHTTPTPRAGGIGIALGLLAGLLALWEPGLLLDSRWGAGLAMFAVGLLDDRKPLPWQLRLGAQFVIVTAAVLLIGLPDRWMIPLAAVWVVALVNAFNMIDNMDMLSGGTAVVAAGWLGALALLGGEDARPEFVLAAAVAGFLVFNLPPARLFMGDGGSMLLGVVLGTGGVEWLARTSPRWMNVGALLAVLALPLYDLVVVVGLRLVQGRSPFQADKQHVSHRLVRAGLTPAVAVGLLHLLALASGAAGVILYETSSPLAAGVLVAGWIAFAGADLVIVRRHFRSRESPARGQ
jgi:UDP-GlcNAc:undecaprenyl-phosphate GlcNAc-1-phosphate transferase